MCQLTLTCIDGRKNVAVTLLSALINSDHNAPHGFGFFNGEYIWKTATKAADIANLGDVISSQVTKDVPIMSHVRLASKGIELKVENNHPFETEHFIGAHNGTLYLKEESAYTNYNDTNSSRGSDSARFFSMLEEEYVANGNKFLEAIRTTMDKHKGKFAFLIYEKLTDTYYVIRGRTADLHFTEVFVERGKTDKYIGFIVNTEKIDLERIAWLAPNIWGLNGDKGIYKFTKAENLKQETIYVVKGNKLKELGELKENYPYAATTTTTPRTTTPYYGNFDYGTGTKNRKKSDKVITIEVLVRSIVEFQNKHFLAPQDIDLIFYKTLGIPMAEADEESLTDFVKYVMPSLNKTKKERKVFRNLAIKVVPYYFYTPESEGGFGLEFPWMVNSQVEIDKAIKKYDDRVRAERAKYQEKISGKLLTAGE